MYYLYAILCTASGVFDVCCHQRLFCTPGLSGKVTLRLTLRCNLIFVGATISIADLLLVTFNLLCTLL